jgi:hypothetical protein
VLPPTIVRVLFSEGFEEKLVLPGPPPALRFNVPKNVVVQVPGSYGPIKLAAAGRAVNATLPPTASAMAHLKFVILPPCCYYFGIG